MPSNPFRFDAAAMCNVADQMGVAADSLTIPSGLPVDPAATFRSTSAAADGTVQAQQRITAFATSLTTVADQIRTATAQFADTEAANAARLEVS